MTESANLTPFVCKWLYSHSKPQHFETQEKLRNHIDKHDINSCNRSSPGDPIYVCPWKGCNKQQSSIIKLEKHLHRHTQQRPFKCPICTFSRFCSPDALNQHLIINHNDSVVNSDTDGGTCVESENEELNLAQVKDKIDIHMEKEGHKDEATTYIKGKDNEDEIIPMDNTAKLSYRDVLVKSRVIENKEKEDFMNRYYKRQQLEQAIEELLYKAMGALSLSRRQDYDSDNENYDDGDLPVMPQEVLTEAQENEILWKSFCKAYKGTEAGEYLSKASEMREELKNGF